MFPKVSKKTREHAAPAGDVAVVVAQPDDDTMTGAHFQELARAALRELGLT